jgi:hypothetical protein
MLDSQDGNVAWVRVVRPELILEAPRKQRTSSATKMTDASSRELAQQPATQETTLASASPQH